MSAIIQNHAPLLLEDFVNTLLQSSDMLALRKLHCQTSGSEVVLRGCVSSSDIKQLAQSMVKSACGMREVTNEIVVRAEDMC